MTPTPDQRERALARALLVPAVVVTLLMSGVEIWRLAAPARAQVGRQVPASLADAIVHDDLVGANALIRTGTNPGALLAVYDPVLTGEREVLVPPIVWAAAAGRQAIVVMLIGAGVSPTRPVDLAAACVADRLGFDGIADALRTLGKWPPPDACPAAGAGPPLVAVLDALPPG